MDDVGYLRGLIDEALGTLSVDVDLVDYDIEQEGPETIRARWVDCEDATAVAYWKLEGSGHIPLFTDAFMPGTG